MRYVLCRRATLALLIMVAIATPSAAQQGRNRPEAVVEEAPRNAEGKKILTLASYGEWKRVGATALSPDGMWLSYGYTPNDGDGKLFVKELDGTRLYEIPLGAQPSFTDDSRWVAYTVTAPTPRGGARGEGAPQPQPQQPPGGRGGRGGGAGARKLELLRLDSGEKVEIANVSGFTFAAGSRVLIARRTRAGGGEVTHTGTDLVIRDLATGMTQTFGNVSAYALNEGGRLLAYVVDAADKIGNGVFLYDLSSGALKPLRAGAFDYDQLSWKADGSALAFLEGETKRGEALRANRLLYVTGAGTAAMKTIEFDPAKDASFPRDHVLSEFGGVTWSRDGTKLFVGVKPQEPAVERGTTPLPNVDVWHWRDTEVQSVQQIRAEQNRRFTYSAAYNLANNKLVVLADDDMRTVQRPRDGRYGIGRLDEPYRYEIAWGGSRGDYYRVDLDTGERTLLVQGISRSMGTSPDGRWYLFLQNGDVFARNLETLAPATNLSKIAGVNFVNVDDDHPYELPAYGVAGWSKDGKQVLLNHRFDVWAVPLAGGKPVNLTSGVGEAEQIRFRITRFTSGSGGGRGGGGGGGATADDDIGIDLTKPITLSAYGERTKKSGYYELKPGAKPQPIIFADRSIGGVQKAKNADRIMFTQQTFTEFPDVWVADTRFTGARKVTDANPQLTDYAWSPGRVLIDYTDARGNKLQGTLALPANYQPGRRYPMLVYFYEKMSDQHFRFSMPGYDDRPHISTYTSDGYLVLQPDVVYTIGRPGTSAVDDVTSAVKKVVELGYADPARIGLQGHSWGGYQSSYIVTQTNMFAAVVTGAPVTNLVSFYNELYKSTGTVQQGIMEVGQVRMGRDSTPWSAHAQFEDQSPVHNAEKIKTPFMILHGTADGAVDWHQGLEFYNSARRLGKEVVLLSYPDEPHHLGRLENQKDFQIRMKQYFDHYLKGAAAPAWLTEGVPFLKKNVDRPTVMPATTANGGGR